MIHKFSLFMRFTLWTKINSYTKLNLSASILSDNAVKIQRFWQILLYKSLFFAILTVV